MTTFVCNTDFRYDEMVNQKLVVKKQVIQHEGHIIQDEFATLKSVGSFLQMMSR